MGDRRGNTKIKTKKVDLGIDKEKGYLYNETTKYWEEKCMVLTRSELEIMDVLWDSNVPLSRGELLEQSTDKNWKDSSVHILLNGLLRKGAIREVGFVKRSKTYGRTFAPALSREAYFATTIFSHRKKPDFVGLVAELLKRDDLSQEQLAQVLELAKSAQK